MTVKTLKRQKLFMAIGFAGFLAASSPGFATQLVIPVGGAQVNIGGCLVISPTGDAFLNTLCTTPNVFDAGSPDTGSYAGLTGGTIQNLTGPPPTGNLLVPIVNFATFFTSSGTVHFDLTRIEPGFGTSAACSTNTVGNLCTPTGSGFTLTQTATNKVAITLSLDGIAYLGTSASGSSPTSFLFTSQNTLPGTISGILALAGTAGGFQSSYSATGSSVSGIPEPGTLTMLFSGAVLGAGFLRRRLASR